MCESSKNTEIYVANNEDVKQKWRNFAEEFTYNRYIIPNTHELIAVYINTLIKDKPLVHSSEFFYRAVNVHI